MAPCPAQSAIVYVWPIDLLFGPVAPLAREVELVRKTSPSWGCLARMLALALARRVGAAPVTCMRARTPLYAGHGHASGMAALLGEGRWPVQPMARQQRGFASTSAEQS